MSALREARVHTWGPEPRYSSLCRYLSVVVQGMSVFPQEVSHVGSVCRCQWISVDILPPWLNALSWLPCLLRTSCVLCSGKGHHDTCTWSPPVHSSPVLFVPPLCWACSLSLLYNAHLHLQQLMRPRASFTLKQGCLRGTGDIWKWDLAV